MTPGGIFLTHTVVRGDLIDVYRSIGYGVAPSLILAYSQDYTLLEFFSKDIIFHLEY